VKKIIKVFIIDDSLLVRLSIKKIISIDKHIQVIGEAQNPIDAFDEFEKVGLPDVFILDLEMPKMNGLSFLEKLQYEKPIPTIICSSYVTSGSSEVIDCLRLGACDIILKPTIGLENSIDDIRDEFITKIYAASNSKKISIPKALGKAQKKSLLSTNKIIAIGISTGGVQTLEQIFVNLLPKHAPIVVVQHMPAGFTASLANSLNKICANSIIKEAQDGDILRHGQILISPGDRHIEVVKYAGHYKTVLKDYPAVSSHKPSVDVLFTSLSKEAKEDAIAFILTGMGRDGAAGIKKIKENGGITYGQDEKSSIVYGMPKVAFEIGGISKQVALNNIAPIINNIGQ